MKTRNAIIAGAMLCGGLLALTVATAAYAETTANNSDKQLGSLQAAPQGVSDAGYFVGSGGAVAEVKAPKPKVRRHR
jgi:hypothetical protein